MTAILLVAHGSRDPRAMMSTASLVRAVAAAVGDTTGPSGRAGPRVLAAYLDHAEPSVGAALARLAEWGHRAAVAVPLLLTAAYHSRVDVPAQLAQAHTTGIPVCTRQTPVLGAGSIGVTHDLVRALQRRLAPLSGYDGVVLAAAGTRDPGARAGVAAVADALAAAAGVPCRVGYASAGGPTPAEAVAALRRVGARRIAVAAYFLALGQLYDRAVALACRAGAIGAAAPLGDAPEIVALVLARARAGGWSADVGVGESVQPVLAQATAA